MGGYIPSTREERAQMLQAIGLETPAELFSAVPEALRVQKLNLEPVSYTHLMRLAATISYWCTWCCSIGWPYRSP